MTGMLKLIFYTSGVIILMAMLLYSLSLKLISRLYKSKVNKKDYSHQPTVTIMVVAHNEEKVILDKLNNILEIDYPQDKIEYLVASDNSTDKTNKIVNGFIKEHEEVNIRLYEVKTRKGKTNAQNEAQKTVTTEFLVMTDANSMLSINSIKELMASFVSEDIAYVSGALQIINEDTSDVSRSEKSYWDSDLKLREIESRIQTITAGNGAIYACRTKEYRDFDPIKSHDSAMPLFYALSGKRAICNHDAIAYEKAGENIKDEFGRKVRMNRRILFKIMPDIRLLNIFKYKWFSYFYFGHRTCRYLLWITHLSLLISNIFLIKDSIIYSIFFAGQILFYLAAIIQAIIKSDIKYLKLAYYYVVTIIAQWIGVYNIISGKAKPFWEKAETTR